MTKQTNTDRSLLTRTDRGLELRLTEDATVEYVMGGLVRAELIRAARIAARHEDTAGTYIVGHDGADLAFIES